MEVAGLQAKITGGVHIHSGTSCEDATTQGGHYFDGFNNGGVVCVTNAASGDPWFNEDCSIAQTGTGYSTDGDGKSENRVSFDAGVNYDNVKGKVIVIHDQVKADGGVIKPEESAPLVGEVV